MNPIDIGPYKRDIVSATMKYRQLVSPQAAYARALTAPLVPVKIPFHLTELKHAAK